MATFELAFGAALVAAQRLRSWRAPVLGVVTLQFALHSVNHLVDAGEAEPESVGWFDFSRPRLSTVVLAWMFRRALAERTAA